jgi:hypothetical protein
MDFLIITQQGIYQFAAVLSVPNFEVCFLPLIPASLARENNRRNYKNARMARGFGEVTLSSAWMRLAQAGCKRVAGAGIEPDVLVVGVFVGVERVLRQLLGITDICKLAALERRPHC